ncbi:hypothetical protein J3E64_004125 [Sphingobium sp. OAS761]|uniref:DUF2889 domain-containing protein n=1 Tax=Sphingobium sp. OAS761 TaxID=2817901 RepID=UPI0020A07FAA|nr:DUF2889 domain-containing protein [Sphingobium sp. OAS761]MCP1472407.1 hypothetical protein [Sphingobium sp. OAS761]
MTGTARDILTPANGEEPTVLGTGSYRLRVSPRREILELEASPVDPRMAELIGVRAGGESRRQMAAVIGNLIGTPLYQIFDDFAGASLVAAWIWSQWMEDWEAFAKSPDRQRSHGRNGAMLNICTGFAEGSSALAKIGTNAQNDGGAPHVGPLVNDEDIAGWHEMPEQSGPAMRRARRIDVWCDGDILMVDAGFQDSGTSPQGGRRAVHEYRVYAEIEAQTGVLLSLQALPLILPFPECPGASIKATRMVGREISTFRDAVLEVLPDTLGCTHLNDVLRALADVPALARNLASAPVE